MATIYDVAKAANVSKSTVSRVINNQDNISVEAKQRVLKAIEELNYQPSKFARALTNVGLDAIMILTYRSTKTTVDNPFFAEATHAIASVAEDEGFDVILQTSENPQDQINKCMVKVKEKMIRGIIILSSPTDQEFFTQLDSFEIPIVLLGNLRKEYKNIFSVDTDNYKTAYELTQILINKGHRKIACIHSPLESNVSVDRLAGYTNCLKDNGIKIKDTYIINSGYTLESASDSAKKILTSNNVEIPTAIFATDDLKVIGLYGVASELGISIPNELSVTGYSNNLLSKLISPSLTSVEIPSKKIATTGAQLLFEKIKKQKYIPKKTLIPTTIIKRNSVSSIES